MKRSSAIWCVVVAVILHTATAQLPPRLNIPGAVLVSQPKPFRTQRINDSPPPLRLRRPQPIPHPIPAPIRPVVEEPEEAPSTPGTSNNNFEDEVTKLGISALQTGIRQAVTQEEENPRPVHFRPERPVPVLRENIRENAGPSQRPPQQLRQHQEPRENIPRPLLRQEAREEGVPVRQPQPVRHAQVRQQIPVQPPPQPVRQATRGPSRQPSQYIDDEGRPGRTRKPPVQILRKYRTDNPDGSITWGFENEDGTFKEETLGVDCITRGNYGYIDPDGVRREYKYETGNKCDEPEEEEEELLPQRPNPQFQPQPRKPPQFRPPGGI